MPEVINDHEGSDEDALPRDSGEFSLLDRPMSRGSFLRVLGAGAAAAAVSSKVFAACGGEDERNNNNDKEPEEEVSEYVKSDRIKAKRTAEGIRRGKIEADKEKEVCDKKEKEFDEKLAKLEERLKDLSESDPSKREVFVAKLFDAKKQIKALEAVLKELDFSGDSIRDINSGADGELIVFIRMGDFERKNDSVINGYYDESMADLEALGSLYVDASSRLKERRAKLETAEDAIEALIKQADAKDVISYLERNGKAPEEVSELDRKKMAKFKKENHLTSPDFSLGPDNRLSEETIRKILEPIYGENGIKRMKISNLESQKLNLSNTQVTLMQEVKIGREVVLKVEKQERDDILGNPYIEIFVVIHYPNTPISLKTDPGFKFEHIKFEDGELRYLGATVRYDVKRDDANADDANADDANYGYSLWKSAFNQSETLDRGTFEEVEGARREQVVRVLAKLEQEDKFVRDVRKALGSMQ